MKKILILTGAPGTGKTETAKRLIFRCPQRSACIDTDRIVDLWPFRVDEDFNELFYANLTACLLNYGKYGAQVIVISGVILPEGIYHRLKAFENEMPAYSWHYYGLTASPECVAQRIRNDSKGQDTDGRLQFSYMLEQVYEIPGCHVLKTDSMSLEEITDYIAQRENLEVAETPAGNPAVELSCKDALDLCRRLFESRGFSGETAEQIADDLVRAEIEGFPSHGLLRVQDHLDMLEKGRLVPGSNPLVRKISPGIFVVDGNKSTGMQARHTVCETMLEELKQSSFCMAGLVHANHIGRLAHLAYPIAKAGYIVIGGVNYLGAGQHMPVHGGSKGRFNTNPILFAFPRKTESPLLIDQTSSAVSEGKIRQYFLEGKKVPVGWLLSPEHAPVTNPALLYSKPPAARLAPLGGDFAYKGVNLALAVELLAGVMTGAGYVRSGPTGNGNGGFFLAFSPCVFGLSENDFAADTETLLSFLREDNPAEGFAPFRVPGESIVPPGSHLPEGKKIRIPETIFKLLQD